MSHRKIASLIAGFFLFSSVALADNRHVITDTGSTTVVTGTVTVGTHAVTVASGGIASGALAAGSIAVGAIAPGATSIAANEDTASADADTLVKVAAIRDDTLDIRSGTEGDYEPLHLNGNGALWATLVANQSVNVAQFNGVTPLMGNGATGTGAVRVSIANDSTGVVQPGNTANTTPWLTTNTPSTSGGLSVFNGTSSDGGTALTSTAQVIKASAGMVFGWYIYNPNATAQFVQLYNTAQASVTVGTTNPLFMLTIPATSAANVEFSNGIVFSNAGFSCSATSTAGGNGAPTTALDAVILYK